MWDELIKEVDINGDGEVSLKEFKKMMGNLLIGKSEDNKDPPD